MSVWFESHFEYKNNYTIFVMKTFTQQAENIEQNVALSNIFDELIKDQQNSLMQANENHKKYLGGMFMCLFGIENCKKGAVANSYLGWYKNEKEFAKEVARVE